MILLFLSSAINFASNERNIQFQEQANKDNMMYQRHMYEIAKKDQIAFWKMQNEYNTPAAQMQRYEQAGLNPMLMYGKSGDNSASNLPLPQRPNYTIQAKRSDFNASNELAMYFDIENKKIATDNLKKQNTVLVEEALLKRAQTEKTIAEANRQGFDLKVEQDLRNYTIEGRQEDVRKKKLENEYIVKDYDLRKAAQEQNIRESISRIAVNDVHVTQSKEVTEEIRKNVRLKELEIILKEKGLNWNDPMILRFLVQGLDLPNLKDIKPAEVQEFLNNGIDNIIGNLSAMINPFSKENRKRLKRTFGVKTNRSDLN